MQVGDDDVSLFDTKFTKQPPIDSPDDSTLSESANLVFQVIICFSNKLSLPTEMLHLHEDKPNVCDVSN